MYNHLFIPANVNFERLIAQHTLGVDGWRFLGVTPLNLAIICDHIIRKQMYNREDYLKRKMVNGYLIVSSRKLEKKVRSYRNCIRFLMLHGILLCNNYYIPGTQSKGYKISYHYNKQYALFPSVKYGAQQRKKVNAEILSNPQLALLYKTRAGLIGWLKSAGFQINEAALTAYLNNEYIGNYLTKKGITRDSYNYKEVFEQAQINKGLLQTYLPLINQKEDIFYKIDTTGSRLHSPITNMPKEMRNFLTYGGQRLVALDIKNSQPYFSTLLLNMRFYTEKKSKLSLYKLDNTLYKLINKQIVGKGINGNTRATIMLCKMSETLATTEDGTLANYLNDALSDTVYDNFVSIPQNHPDYKEMRKNVKDRFFKIIYGVPKRSVNNRTFYTRYEVAFQLFDLIRSVETGIEKKNPAAKYNEHKVNHAAKVNFKREQQRKNDNDPIELLQPVLAPEMIDKGYTSLSILLQKLESYVLLDVICAGIYKQNKNIPLFTVHDSIATTEEHIDFVEQYIMETLTNLVGHPPTLQHENWF